MKIPLIKDINWYKSKKYIYTAEHKIIQIQCILFNSQHTLCNIQYTSCNIQCTSCNIQCTLCLFYFTGTTKDVHESLVFMPRIFLTFAALYFWNCVLCTLQCTSSVDIIFYPLYILGHPRVHSWEPRYSAPKVHTVSRTCTLYG